MLIEFRVNNFKSIRDEQVLSLAASGDKHLMATHTQDTGIKALPRLLKSCAFYGANASGKSTLIKAIWYMRAVILESSSKKPGDIYNVQPFKLDPEKAKQPTSFEMSFLLNGIRHQYGFELTAQRIVSEHLFVYRTQKPQKWFERRYDSDKDEDIYELGGELMGDRSVWKKATRDNTLFLSTAVQLNSEQLRPVFEWFASHLVVLGDAPSMTRDFSISMARQSEAKAILRQYLQAADFGIDDLSVKSVKAMGRTLNIDMATGQQSIEEGVGEFHEVYFSHTAGQGKVEFSFGEESLGTQRFFSLCGPIIDILQKGLTVIVDELDSSLHPLLMRNLLEKFHSSQTNPLGAQIIFSTHDTSLLDTEFLRRDQFWFLEKDASQATHLYPLSDYSPRKGEALEKGYLMGRYGAVPVLAASA